MAPLSCHAMEGGRSPPLHEGRRTPMAWRPSGRDDPWGGPEIRAASPAPVAGLDLESLETRQLLSHVSPKPASGNDLNPDGSTNFDQIIGASAARSEFNVDGTGQTVAVIDTGVDYNNPALGGAIGSGDKVVAGVDFTGSPNGVLPTWQHGTGVAGLIAGNGAGLSRGRARGGHRRPSGLRRQQPGQLQRDRRRPRLGRRRTTPSTTSPP